MKKILTVILIIVLALTFVACEIQTENSGATIPAAPSSEEDPALSGEGEGGATDEGATDADAESGFDPADGGGSYPYSHKVLDGISGGYSGGISSRIPSGGIAVDVVSGDPKGGENQNYQAGQITAKARTDNDHYEEWVALFAEATDNDPAGKFSVYKDGIWAFDTSMRVTVRVTQGGEPVFGAFAEYYDDDQNKWISRTDVNGVSYLFPPESSGMVKVKSGEYERTVEFSQEQRELNVELDDSEAQANVIKLMFVIDATGSMGDEMNYIAAELSDVIHRVTEQADQVRIDLSLLFYRDNGDTEKFAFHDFVTVTGDEQTLAAQVEILTKQRASGGGDYEEAVDEALLMAASADWGEENSTNLIVFVLDAPPHDTEQQLETTARGLDAAIEKGIRICPVLCSGANTFCEYVMRTSALLTGGTSVFVTDDSGIGGEHLDPDLPEETVEKLNDLLVRLIVGYHTGNFGTPIAWDQQSSEQA